MVFSQDLINQGREKVVEATNSVAAARIQPLEDIISAIVSAVDNPGLRSGVENIKHYQTKLFLLQMVIQLMNCIIKEHHFQLGVTFIPAVTLGVPLAQSLTAVALQIHKYLPCSGNAVFSRNQNSNYRQVVIVFCGLLIAS